MKQWNFASRNAVLSFILNTRTAKAISKHLHVRAYLDLGSSDVD